MALGEGVSGSSPEQQRSTMSAGAGLAEGDDPGKGCVMEAELNENFWMLGHDSTTAKGILVHH